ncbi:uncharacterized protein K452DRAFT_143956 [Aplosporella prunicola CBS 121167]|uniref:Uncharacterized protein n=1 Tax=Aplosporella prunicola CBS 121167 TaxID=1176127 RepID=A0A6A6BMV4_9PEZI|nr:uncharacterized protein K452DRAFT_143956 [Aplosporella prunicola CBS 121167]KAF2144585.1 hypothetical protein K452DRAFT_143956 [Aplosporella prunicola CBS 121167]
MAHRLLWPIYLPSTRPTALAPRTRCFAFRRKISLVRCWIGQIDKAGRQSDGLIPRHRRSRIPAPSTSVLVLLGLFLWVYVLACLLAYLFWLMGFFRRIYGHGYGGKTEMGEEYRDIKTWGKINA